MKILKDDRFLLKINPNEISEEIALFERFFWKELAVIKEAYGDYEIGWGIIQSFS
jgi:hypothetical protein